MIDRDFEQVSEEHMKSTTKPEGPAQEPATVEQVRDAIAHGGDHRDIINRPAPAPSQPAGAREWLRSRTDIPDTLYGLQTLSGLYQVMDAYAREQTAAKDAEIERLVKQHNQAYVVLHAVVVSPVTIKELAKRVVSRLVAAERERNSLRAENAALKAGKEMKMDYDIEAISAAVHEQWMENKRKAGVSSRKLESGEELMVPYEQLSEQAKELDRGSVRAVVAAIEQVNRHDR